MKRPTMKRLVDSPGNDYARAALRSGRGDAPSKRALERTAIGLGITTGTALTAGSGSAATTTSATLTGAAGGATGAGLSGLTGLAGISLVKAVAVTLAAGALATSVILFRPEKGRPPVPPPASAQAPSVEHPPLVRGAAGLGPRPPTPAPAASPVRASPVSAAARAPMPAAPAASPGAAPVAATPVAPRLVAPTPVAPMPVAPAPVVSATSARDLTEAMAHLEAAHAALAAGDPATALVDVDDYERRFPNGALSPEASVLRIDALLAMGADSAALEAAKRFLAAAPDSPHARRVRAIVTQIHERGTNP